MRNALLVCAAVASVASFTAAASMPVISEHAWLQTMSATLSRIRAELPKQQPINMKLDHMMPTKAIVTEPTFDIHLEYDAWMQRISGDIKAFVFYALRKDSRYGIDILGGGVNVGLRPFGNDAYILNGVYRKNGKNANLNLLIRKYFRDMEIMSTGINLRIRWNIFGYDIEGTVDPNRYGLMELDILGAALAAVTHSEFYPPLR